MTTPPPQTRPTPIRAPTNPTTLLPHLRAPHTSSPSFHHPTLSWLQGTWWVTHSSMSFWKDKRNITITYTPTPPSSSTAPLPPALAAQPQHTDRLDDIVQYQDAKSSKVKDVKGKNTAAPDDAPEADGSGWDWRGKGIIKAAYSTWSIIGWGEDEDGNAWMVTYFKKTVFTPAAVQMYSRAEDGLSAPMVRKLELALQACESEEVRKLGAALYQVTNDGARSAAGAGTGTPRGSVDVGRERGGVDDVRRSVEALRV